MTKTKTPPGAVQSPMFLREHEFLVRITTPVERGMLCAHDGKPLMGGQFAWDHRISSGPGYDGRPWRFGEDPFTGARHADGTECVSTMCFSQPRCPECHSYNTLDVVQEAYGDRTTCKVPACTYTHYFSIGD